MNFKVCNLISNKPNVAKNQDTDLQNPWGMVIKGDEFWIADNHSDGMTHYTEKGCKNAPNLVCIPGGPTGVVKNHHEKGFKICFNGLEKGSDLIIVTEAGKIYGYNKHIDPNKGILAVDNSNCNAVYKGVELADNRLYIADFSSTGKVAVYDDNFCNVTSKYPFTDPCLPEGYAPFNIFKNKCYLYVAYAHKANSEATDEDHGAGLGLINIFDFKGCFISRLVDVGGCLNAPWGMAIAPKSFGNFKEKLLVGNFGDGKINVYPTKGCKVSADGKLKDRCNNDIAIEGLWALVTEHSKVYFTSGPNDEQDGLVGSIVKD